MRVETGGGNVDGSDKDLRKEEKCSRAKISKLQTLGPDCKPRMLLKKKKGKEEEEEKERKS